MLSHHMEVQPMLRKLFLGLSALVAAACAFGVTTYALGSGQGPHLRSNLPARQLPATSLPASLQVSLNNSIGRDGVEHFGITADSYTQVRRIADTPAGVLYLIPGSNGACLVFDGAAASCGDPGASAEPMLSLLIQAPSTDLLVGGGVTSDAIHKVRHKGVSQSFGVVNGAFVVSEADGVKPSHGLELIPSP
jgi:hypothetical protein